MRKEIFWMCCMVMLVALQLLPCYAHAQPAAETAARITKSGGEIIKNKAGEIETIGLPDTSDDFVESIDFTVFPHLKMVFFGARRNGPVTDRSLAHLEKKSTGLEQLTIDRGAKVTGKGLSALLKMHPSIRGLSLNGPTITDETLTGLKDAKELNHLDLFGTKITDDGLKSLENCQALNVLTIPGAKVTDAGMVHVSKLTSLVFLTLEETAITDKGLLGLGALDKLVSINVSSTKITDAGMVHLGKLVLLVSLDLRGTAVTDKGLMELSDLSFLRSINVSKTKVTAKGIEALQASLPDLMIEK